MPTKFYIRPYKAGSQSAKVLAEALGGKRLKLEGSNYRPRPGHVIINWGNSGPLGVQLPRAPGLGIETVLFLNEPQAVAKAVNKLETLRVLHDSGINAPPYTTDARDTEDWGLVCIRHKLSGHSGEGLVIKKPNEMTEADKRAPLFTKYIPKKAEFRIHVGIDPDDTGRVIFKQKKARRLDVPDDAVNWQIRNHANGFIFAHNDIDVPGVVCDVAIQAVRELGLDFGAVDVVLNEKSGRAFVLEVNTSCGLEGETVNAYARYFREIYNA